jgi:carbon monoxide dehydrogenase subunit G
MSSYPVRPVTVSEHIPAPAPDVLAFVSDTRNDPAWCPNVDSVEMTSTGPIATGSTFRYTQHLDQPGRGRVTFDGDVEVVALDDRSITWRVTDKFQERAITCVVEPDGAGSRVTQTTEAAFRRSPGMARWLYPVMARRTLRDQLRHLRAHFEG